MIVADRRLSSNANRFVKDLEAGDLVRRKGQRGVGVVESVTGGNAMVAYGDGHKDILPVSAFRRIRAVGHELDRRARQ